MGWRALVGVMIKGCRTTAEVRRFVEESKYRKYLRVFFPFSFALSHIMSCTYSTYVAQLVSFITLIHTVKSISAEREDKRKKKNRKKRKDTKRGNLL